MNPPIKLLNASYEQLEANYPPHKAARLLSLRMKDGRPKAVVEESLPGQFLGPFPYPLVLRLNKHVKVAYNRIYGPPRVSKRGVLTRDKYRCAYDGCKNVAKTIDHVIPKSRTELIPKGGFNTWQNLVAACSKCNHKKGARTPQEAGMRLMWKGYVPSKAELFEAYRLEKIAKGL